MKLNLREIGQKCAKISVVSVVVAAVIAPVFLTGCGERKEWRHASGAVWNTVYNITYEANRDMSDSIQAVYRRVENSLSPFNDSSLISRINRCETDSTDELVRHVFAVSSEVGQQSGGRFDPTISPAVNLWKFGYTGKVAPDEKWEPTRRQIDSVLFSVGIADCQIDSFGKIHKKTPQTTFNFSAVTKGYACDLVADMLQRNGAKNLMVEIGGEVTVRGENPRGAMWRLQIDAPVEQPDVPTHQRLETIDVTDCGVATSGNYRNYHESSRGKVGHTIDPQTGEPCRNDILSVTVIAPTCGEADAYATAAMASPTSHYADSILVAAGLKGIIVTAPSQEAGQLAVKRFGNW